MAALCMCVCEQEGGQAGSAGATPLSTKTGSVLLLPLSHTEGERIKIYMRAVVTQAGETVVAGQIAVAGQMKVRCLPSLAAATINLTFPHDNSAKLSAFILKKRKLITQLTRMKSSQAVHFGFFLLQFSRCFTHVGMCGMQLSQR